MQREILGHIDCPSCGTKAGMRITADKNGDPFGFCEADCGQQLRVGGDKRRVAKFVGRYPWAAGKTPVPVTGTAPTPSAPEPAKPVPAPVPKKTTPPRSSFADAVSMLTGGR